MTKKQKTTPKISRTYLTFLDENSDKITLSFRSEKIMKEHIKEHEICENDILYAGSVRPINENQSHNGMSLRRTVDKFDKYIRTLSEEGGELTGT